MRLLGLFDDHPAVVGDPLDPLHHVLEADTVIRILIYNVYPRKATSFYKIFRAAFVDGTVYRERIVFKTGPHADLFIGKFFENGCKTARQSHKRALSPADLRNVVYGFYADGLGNPLLGNRFQEKIKFLGLAVGNLRIVEVTL